MSRASRLASAKARQQEAVAAYQGAVSVAFKEAADALSNLQAAGQSEPDLKLRAEASTRAAKLAQMRFEAGYSGYLDVLDAQRSLNAATLDQVRNRQARLNYSVDLFKVLGGGWVAEAGQK